MSEERNILRYSLLPSLLKVAEYNLARNITDINIFEIGARYYLDNKQYIEEDLLSGILVGNYITNNWQGKNMVVDFYVLKGLLEELFSYLGLSKNISIIKPNNPPKEFHIGMSAEILLDNKFIGYIGCINPAINKLPIYIFEISLKGIYNKKINPIIVKEIPKYPSIIKDLAFILNKDIESKDIIDTMYGIGGSILEKVDIFDLYIDDSIGKDNKSLAFNLEFRDYTKTLTDEEVKLIINKITKEIENKYKGELRDK